MTTAATWQQTSLVDDLLTTIENDPTSIDARKLLIEQYESLGWDDAAAGEARTIIELFPDAKETPELLSRYGKDATKKSKKKSKQSKRPAKKSADSTKHSALDVQQLGVEYIVLQDDAKKLLRELSVLADLSPETDLKDRLAELTALSEGRMFSVARGRCGKDDGVGGSKASKSGIARSARAVAATMKADRDNALDLAISDLEAVIERTPTKDDKDATRDALRKRAEAVKSALSTDIAHVAFDALMHVEHEKLAKSYQNDETMLGDPIGSIARADFWVSDDGYAWDMDELVQAIRAGKGAMRNPLTKESFSTDDVAAIIRHPKGRALAALEVEQTQLRKGVRAETIEKLRALSTTMLVDMSENSQPSHEAVDAFLLYVATLPPAEQEAVDKLRVPAVDSHTRQPFDDTVGDAVRDAKGNRLCFHKAGDFLKQAAEFLGRSQAG